MIVSWDWLKEYVALDMPSEEVELRLMMAGLNHESTESVGDDLAIDLEVTSNRPDCLGHIGVAREIGVLFDKPLCIPDPTAPTAGGPTADQIRIAIHCDDLCSRYSGRVIRGVKVGPSPDWLQKRLTTAGIGVVNNVVDITNYVLLECGQPLHAFDLAQLAGPAINVREAEDGEEFLAIDHRTYKLTRGTCVIADDKRAVAIGGVMGGADSEVSESTTDLLIEAAEFSPLSIRNTARKLNLHSPASYRFERGIDPEGVDWASRRCCQLILEICGGELCEGVVDVGQSTAARKPVTLRFEQLERILGITVPAEEPARILKSLGNELVEETSEQITVRPPSWRRDLTREADLIEEVARIHGYDKIPEDVLVPMWPSHLADRERVATKVRAALNANGFDEAITATLVPTQWSEAFSPWSSEEPIRSSAPMKGILADAPKELGQADTIRRSLVPSLLEARRYNESVANPEAELFELAKVYLPHQEDLPREQWTVALVSGSDLMALKGVIESALAAVRCTSRLRSEPADLPLLGSGQACRLFLDDEELGFLGQVSEDGLQRFSLRSPTVVAELRLDTIEKAAELIPQYEPLSPYPQTSRDVNLIVADDLAWSHLETTVIEAAGELLEDLIYQETYRDPERDGAGTKRLLFSFTLRSAERTLTNEEADQVRDKIVKACSQQHSARLLG